jgi:flagellar motor switch protein FliM
MSVLRKKIDKAVFISSLDVEKVKRVWSDTHELMLEGLTRFIDPLYWKVDMINVFKLAPADIAEVFPERGIYTAIGATERDMKCVISFDPKLAAIVSKYGFASEVSDLENLDGYEFSEFDIAIMDEFIRSVRRNLDMPSLTYRSDFIDFSQIPLVQDQSEWVKVELNFLTSLTPKSENARLSVSVLLRLAHLKDRLRSSPDIPEEEKAIEFDEDTEALTRHVDQSHTPLRTVLESREMTVADCTRLSIGQVIPLPGISLKELRVEAELRNTRVCIAKGALGIHKTRRAIQLVEDIDKAFVDNALSY